MWLSGELTLISHEFKQPDNSVINYVHFDNQKLVSLFFNKSKVPPKQQFNCQRIKWSQKGMKFKINYYFTIVLYFNPHWILFCCCFVPISSEKGKNKKSKRS